MGSITAIELGPDACALARISVSGDDLRLLDADVLDRTAFPGDDSFAAGVRQARRRLKLPRRARVVLWGLPEDADKNSPAVTPLLAPLLAAGFRIERVVSPCHALAALARVRVLRGDGAMCWLAVNRGGVAIVVVRPGEQLYAHSYPWDSNVGATGSQARLLQRYSLVSFLSPQVKRAMSEVRGQDATVSAVVTCGNLPDLRSLTMPLIEDLDVEVETLDSLDGLVVTPPVPERLSDLAPAIRLACAGAIARTARGRDGAQRIPPRAGADLRRIAALLLLALAVAALTYGWYRMRQSRVTPASAAIRPAPPPPPRSSAPPVPTSTTPAINRPAPPAPGATVPPKSAPTPAVAAAKAPVPSSTPKPIVVAPPLPPRAAPTPAPATAPAPAMPRALPVAPPPAVKNPSATASAPSSPQSRPAAPPPSAPGRSTAATPPRRASPAPLAPAPALLKEPLPRITAILVANDRRFATIDGGQIVGVGDALGRRTVVGIDEKALVLREPSGVQIRVGLAGRMLGIIRLP